MGVEMKRLALIVLTVIAIGACAIGCSQAKEIGGSCSEVVKACQNMSGDANVTVKGKVVMEGSTKDEAYILSDNGRSGEPWAYVTFKDISDASKVTKGDTVKVKGVVHGSAVQENAIFVTDATLVG